MALGEFRAGREAMKIHPKTHLVHVTNDDLVHRVSSIHFQTLELMSFLDKFSGSSYIISCLYVCFRFVWCVWQGGRRTCRRLQSTTIERITREFKVQSP